jgi:sugar transferase EpsL
MDLAIAIPALVLLTPVMVRQQLGRPVLFRQVRCGRTGRAFTLVKFRTLADARDSEGNLLPNDSPEAYAQAREGKRNTRLGDFLRRTSLDELPELLNIVTGKMSLVGPRPLLVDYLPRYTPEQLRRHEVRPGLTGWAQVSGRAALSWEQRFEHDVWYVDHVSLRRDLVILAHTFVDVLCQRDTAEPGFSTGSEFLGTIREDAGS